MRDNAQRSVVLMAGLLFALTLLVGALPPAGVAAPADTLQIVRLRDVPPQAAQRLIDMGIDLLEARDGPDLFALVTPAERDALRAAGWRVQVELEQTARLQQAGPETFGGGYRTVEAIEQFLRERAARYPGLATLVDFGDSWERQRSGGAAGYDLLALRLTNQATPGPKPVFFLLAAIHAREWTTAEVATRFIDHLLAGYGVDPDITWLLDTQELVVAPMANPDGRKIAEQGHLHRKNTNPSNGGVCLKPPQPIGSSHLGVDLNRNFAFQWNTAGVSSDPCSQVFPGSAPASEPETQALQALIRELFGGPRPRPATGAPAPPDTSGVLISLHSYGDLVLWPWGHSFAPAPNSSALERLGQRMAGFNGYEPWQSTQLYPTSGTTDEWAYAELGVAAYTFELGPFNGPCAGFTPPYSCMDGGSGGSIWPRNLPALLYAARVAGAPYSQPAGPEVRSIDIFSGITTLTVTVVFDGRGQLVTEAELAFGALPDTVRLPVALQAIGAAGSSLVQGQATIPLEALPDGGPPALLTARGRSVAGNWGPVSAAWLQAPAPLQRYQLWVPLVAQSP